ncbi:hypothetical protein [Burkholderia plantarii]|uniref:PLL-like beta propeller domain-containing protein n=1 Tax=Burkholderia plantarii TaxID=41899 RepID=A0A0B6RLA6_BURPL|nr:hypothetical protein [Burkholderia plantarii]AJK46107.1 hypothetical protein BGL_1c15930 [Burkholderia plantarii]
MNDNPTNTPDVHQLASLLLPLRERGMTPQEAVRSILATTATGAANLIHDAGLRGVALLAQALVRIFVALTPAELAIILHHSYPDLSALDVGRLLLAPEVFPHTSRDEMRSALLGAGFDANGVTEAINVLYPAPPVKTRFDAIATSMQAGNRGIEVWSSGTTGQVWTLYQRVPGADWSSWEGPGFKGQPKPLRQLAAALQNNGDVMFAGLDDAGSVWACPQGSPGGDWGAWHGPNLGGQPHAFRQLAASQQGGSRGVELWAAGDDGQVWTLYQLTAGGPWSRWEGPGFKGQPAPMFKMAAAQQNNGNVMFFGLDRNGRLWSIGQDRPGGDWGGWQGPGVAGQPEPFVEIAASEQHGTRGVEVWGLGASGQIWTLYQLTAGGPWSHWEGPGFKGQPVPMKKIAAALQNTGCVLLWAVDGDDRLWRIAQGSPGGDWAGWEQSSVPPA